MMQIIKDIEEIGIVEETILNVSKLRGTNRKIQGFWKGDKLRSAKATQKKEEKLQEKYPKNTASKLSMGEELEARN